ncbi:AI-2E family transporter [Microvirga sp. M2]|uniref:AI-2E family transporter n=1 Tax=Microvirga sp. M2 TaxID=3073270 RepID=UPI0039C4AF68
MRSLEDQAFLLLLVIVSIAFACVLWPYYGAVLWGLVAAIVFMPIYRRLSRALRQKRNLAALTTVLVILMLVILPLTLIILSLLQEASSVYARVQSGELDIGQTLRQAQSALPGWANNLLHRFGQPELGDAESRLSTGLARGLQLLAAQAVDIGQSTLNFIVGLGVMLYLLFFLLRDGDELSRRIIEAVPLRPEQRRTLFRKFTVVIRATVKGDILVALVQGALGGLIFWLLGIPASLLWAVLMAFLSLLPAFGAGLVWAPVGIYFLATGAVAQGLILIAYGVLVIGLVDNILRPILIGKDTKMPDYVVLISTLGGLASFGFNGFVLGPVIAAMFIAVWDIFGEARRDDPDE